MQYEFQNKKIVQFVNEVEIKYSVNLTKRLYRFALDIFSLLKTIRKEKEFDVFRYQLSKSATSIGANYEEAQRAFSIKEFASKIGICLKEARETNYFLRLIHDLKIANEEKCKPLIEESEELKNIIAAILLKIRKKI